MELRHVAVRSGSTAVHARFLRPALKPVKALPRLALLIGFIALGLAGSAAARSITRTIPGPPLITAAPAGTPALVTSRNVPPRGYRLTGAQVLRIAAADPRVRVKLRQLGRTVPYVYTKSVPYWQVSWFSRGKVEHELLQVYVDDQTGRVTQIWTGFQVAWTMARGYPGAFGRRANALYVWLPLCALFLLPFLPRRRRGLSLLHLDLLVLLGFSVSLAFFNRGDIGLSVPLVYPFLVYLLVRMLLLAAGRGVPRRPLPVWPSASWLMTGAVFLLAMRIGLNLLNSNVIDVGYAGVIGADKLIHGHLLYGLWPKDNAYGDTYGPFNYLAYVPFRLIFGWSGTWDSLPAAHAAAIAFDLLTVAGLYLLGRRLRDHALGALLAYAWLAYPFTLFTLSSNSNDALVSATLVLALLALSSAPARGAAAALAGLTKFAPFALAPLFLRGSGRRPTERQGALYIVAFAVTVFVCLQPVLLNGDLSFMWHDSISYQASRVTPFSIWGLWGHLGILQHLLEGAAAALAIIVAFVPRERGPAEVAALAAALILALQLVANYWLYPYVVWFFPLVIVALFATHPPRRVSWAPQTGEHPPAVAAEAPQPVYDSGL